MRRLWVILAVLAGAAGGCSDEDDSNPGAPGGTSGTGGSSGASGKGASGGSGGSAATGGGTTGGSGGSGGSTGGGAGADGGPAGAAGEGPFMPPTKLSETGLYSDPAAGTIAPGIDAYRPRYQLWSDGAEKQRWLKLPAGQTIDTTDMDYWTYPVGTKVWKEFTRGSVRVETRLIQKIGPGLSDWFMMAFQWDQDQLDATAVPGGVQNASGTEHDIPAQTDCEFCHGNVKGRLLSVSAIQLSHDLGGLDLDTLIQRAALSSPPSGEFVVPGGQIESDALGYLHANCGLCHNPGSAVSATLDMQLWLETDSLTSVPETTTYRTTVDVATTTSGSPGAPFRIKPNSVTESSIHVRMNARGSALQMPPIATEIVDTTGINALDAWINSL